MCGAGLVCRSFFMRLSLSHRALYVFASMADCVKDCHRWCWSRASYRCKQRVSAAQAMHVGTQVLSLEEGCSPRVVPLVVVWL